MSRNGKDWLKTKEIFIKFVRNCNLTDIQPYWKTHRQTEKRHENID